MCERGGQYTLDFAGADIRLLIPSSVRLASSFPLVDSHLLAVHSPSTLGSGTHAVTGPRSTPAPPLLIGVRFKLALAHSLEALGTQVQTAPLTVTVSEAAVTNVWGATIAEFLFKVVDRSHWVCD